MKKLILVPLLPATLLAGGSLVLLSSSKILPGQTLSVEIQRKRIKEPSLLWNGTSIRFYPLNKRRVRALVGIPMNQNEGSVEFLVQSKKKEDLKFNLEILSTDHGMETLKFNKEKAKLLNDPSEDEESLLIRKHLKEAEFDEKQMWTGTFIWPLPGDRLSPYGIRRSKVGQKKMDFHRGIDIRGKKGEPIRSPSHGRVIMVKDFKFHGRTVLLSHGQGVGSIYIHMDSIRVKVGDRVKKGQTLGTVGSSGLATAPHLHWGVYVHGMAVDPEQWVEHEF